MRVLYIIGTYPLVTTTFVDREIRASAGSVSTFRSLPYAGRRTEAPLSEEQRSFSATSPTCSRPTGARSC